MSILTCQAGKEVGGGGQRTGPSSCTCSRAGVGRTVGGGGGRECCNLQIELLWFCFPSASCWQLWPGWLWTGGLIGLSISGIYIWYLDFHWMLIASSFMFLHCGLARQPVYPGLFDKWGSLRAKYLCVTGCCCFSCTLIWTLHEGISLLRGWPPWFRSNL